MNICTDVAYVINRAKYYTRTTVWHIFNMNCFESAANTFILEIKYCTSEKRKEKITMNDDATVDGGGNLWSN